MTNLSLYTNYSVEVSAKTIREGPFSDTVYIFSGEGGKRNLFKPVLSYFPPEKGTFLLRQYAKEQRSLLF